MWSELLRFESLLTWSLAFVASEWIIRLVMPAIVVRRRRPTTAMAWLLVIFFEPWIGLVLYWLVGGNRLPQSRIRRHQRAMERLESAAARWAREATKAAPLDSKQSSLARLAENLADMPILGGNRAQLMAETDEVIDSLIADIDAAREHVHLSFYIFADDATGRRVAEALVRAAERGVKCRVLADAVGSRRMFKSLAPWMTDRGVAVHRILPVSFFRRQLARIDLRNHRKLAVIDGRVAYAGSQNIVNADYGHRDLAWHDLMVKVCGPVLLPLQGVFAEDWYFETGEQLISPRLFPEQSTCGEARIQVLPSGPMYKTENYQRLAVAALNAADRRVVITSPYFVPDEPLLQALQTAVLRGVRVELILPQRCDQIMVGGASRAYYDDLLEYGVLLHLYQDGLLHAKTMSVDDDFALIGSGNFDIRSFYLNFELNLLFYDAADVRLLREVQEAYLMRSAILSRDEWRKRAPWRRTFDDVCKLVSPLL